MSAAPQTLGSERAAEGWLRSFKPPHLSFARFLRERLRLTIHGANYEPVEVVYGAGCAYVALQVTRAGFPTHVRAVVAQVEHLSGMAGDANITWRIIDEERLGNAFSYSDGRGSRIGGQAASFGRIFNRCPRGVLEKLTDTTNSGAQAWRRSCWARVRASEALGRRPLSRGDIAVLPEALKFADGAERESFLITQANPLQGIAFGVGPRPISLAPLVRWLAFAPSVDMQIIPTDEVVEVLTASQGNCVGYLIRTTDSHRVVGATNDASLAITFERQWNTGQGDFECQGTFGVGATP